MSCIIEKGKISCYRGIYKKIKSIVITNDGVKRYSTVTDDEFKKLQQIPVISETGSIKYYKNDPKFIVFHSTFTIEGYHHDK